MSAFKCIRCWDLAICPYCDRAAETAEHLVFQCLAHEQARRKTWSEHKGTTNHCICGIFSKRLGW